MNTEGLSEPATRFRKEFRSKKVAKREGLRLINEIIENTDSSDMVFRIKIKDN